MSFTSNIGTNADEWYHHNVTNFDYSFNVWLYLKNSTGSYMWINATQNASFINGVLFSTLGGYGAFRGIKFSNNNTITLKLYLDDGVQASRTFYGPFWVRIGIKDNINLKFNNISFLSP